MGSSPDLSTSPEFPRFQKILVGGVWIAEQVVDDAAVSIGGASSQGRVLSHGQSRLALTPGLRPLSEPVPVVVGVSVLRVEVDRV